MKPLPVTAPKPLHTHWHPEANRFYSHEHLNGGPHRHDLVDGRWVTSYVPGNYSPHPVRGES